MSRFNTVVGVDGCAVGWVCLVLDLATRQIFAHLLPDFQAVLEELPTAIIGVDIPSGLPDMGSRQCDLDAWKLLEKRGSSVFPAPVRGMLAATSYQEACQLGRQTDGGAISRQCFEILPKIREVDCAVTPELQQRLFEVHPEVIIPSIEGIHVGGRAAKDDILGAAAVMWTAERVCRSEGVGVTTVEEFDSKGLRMQITF